MKKTAPDGAVSGMPAIRETGPGKNLQAITVSPITPEYVDELRLVARVKTHYPNNLHNIHRHSNECQNQK
ncbi:hypothetical protein AUS52_26785, partial [Escherichia coli]|uniref:hypothetical protein n=1 Tax=Escherichia coli TaxID=562 RepID=UPI0007733372